MQTAKEFQRVAKIVAKDHGGRNSWLELVPLRHITLETAARQVPERAFMRESKLIDPAMRQYRVKRGMCER